MKFDNLICKFIKCFSLFYVVRRFTYILNLRFQSTLNDSKKGQKLLHLLELFLKIIRLYASEFNVQFYRKYVMIYRKKYTILKLTTVLEK